MTKPTVRTRLAPSPTGIPHIGTARTALYDLLLAKKYSGQFILRIEDTDKKRYVPEALKAIHEINKFLNHIPDEGPEKGGPFAPYIQTQRLDLYKKYADKLVKLGAAYKKDNAIRIKIPKDGYTSWTDLVQGRISVPNQEIDDKVLLKSDGIPTYHLAVVVDDHLMEISHVIRGTEWIVSTPVHLLIYQALNWTPPVFMHVPLLLGPDKTKLSKRHGSKNVLEYKDLGYLPEAINNFLFYLGFSYQDNSKILTLEEMIKIFDETKLHKQNAIFDITKLNYFNSHWIRKLSLKEFEKRIKPFTSSKYTKDFNKLKPLLPHIQKKLTTLKDINQEIKFLFEYQAPSKKALLEQSEVSIDQTISWLKDSKAALQKAKPFTSQKLHDDLAKLQQQTKLTPRQAFMSLRLATTGVLVTPPLFDSLVALGQDETINRLDNAISNLTKK